ncbi:MAG: transposase, partial [Acidobacteriaceae bacterium]|nr:transposase [Acidobacteriaceae bacterium]
MPSVLSLDLRSRIVSACQAAEFTQAEIADLFQVHVKTVEKLWRHFRRTGSSQAKPHGGGVRAHLAGHEEDLRRLVAEQSDHTLAQYVALLWERHQVVTSVPVLSRTLKALGLPQKKSRSRRR